MNRPLSPSSLSTKSAVSSISAWPWRPISEADHTDGAVMQLWAEHARVRAWEWSEDRQRWEIDGADSVFWPEGEYGPTHCCPMATPPVSPFSAAILGAFPVAAE